MKLTKDIDKNIFREYDIRGVYGKQINEDVSYTIGRAFGSYIKELGEKDCIIGYDNRYSSVELSTALIKGITESGIHVLSLGLVTTPMYYYACLKTDTNCGIMVTASHNPKDDNGFKMAFNQNGNAKGKEIQDFYDYTIKQKFTKGSGIVSHMNIKEDYIKYLLSCVDIDKKINAVIDCGNGTTSIIAQEIFTKTGCNILTIYGTSDSNFPNHHPDPSVDENMRVLQNTVKQFNYDVGLAFDGDGDRVGIVDDKGRIIRIDKFMALIAKDLCKTNENKKFLYDVKCGMSLINELKKLGAEGIMTRTGNSYTKALTKENDCIFGGEYSGHVYFRDKFLGFDSGIYAALRVLELLSKNDKKLSEMVDELESFYATPEIKIKASDDKKFKIIDKIKKYANSKKYEYNEIDGVRIEFPDSWVIVRASNTGPNITLRIESANEDKMNELKEEFINLVNKYNEE